MTDLLDRLNKSIIDCETGEPLDDDARPDLYASDVREVIGEMAGLIDKLRPHMKGDPEWVTVPLPKEDEE